MKVLYSFVLGLVLFISGANVCPAWQTGGFVFCDANGNGQIDSSDTPLPGVLIVITNLSGTYSNGDFTTTPQGGFAIELPGEDTYVEYIHPLTLPSDASVVLPVGGSYVFTLDANTSNFLGNFLISSASCSNSITPPPTNGCCLIACGTIGGTKKKAQFIFGGNVVPACGCTNGDSGEWDVMANDAKLHFQGSVFETVSCTEQPGTKPGCASSHSIDFQGAGTLKGVAGCKANYGLVYFYAHAEDHGSQGDSLYFRAYAADGTTLLLISGDSANPTDISPVTICTGNVQIGTSCCPTSHGHDGHGGHDDGDKGDKDHNKGEQDKGDHGKGGNDQGNHGNDQGDHKQGQGSNCNNNQTSKSGGSSAGNHGHSGHK